VLWNVSVVFFLVWLAGLVWGYTMGGFMYVVPVLAACMITVVNIMQSRRTA